MVGGWLRWISHSLYTVHGICLSRYVEAKGSHGNAAGPVPLSPGLSKARRSFGSAPQNGPCGPLDRQRQRPTGFGVHRAPPSARAAAGTRAIVYARETDRSVEPEPGVSAVLAPSSPSGRAMRDHPVVRSAD